MSLEFSRLRLDNASQRIMKFIDENIVGWTEEEILNPILDTVRSLGLSQRVQDAISVEKTDFMKADVVFDLQIDGTDVSDLLEKGFRPHEINAKGKDMDGADWLRWYDESGKIHFAQKVMHPGFLGYHFMEKGYNNNEYNLQRRIERETEEFLEKERLR